MQFRLSILFEKLIEGSFYISRLSYITFSFLHNNNEIRLAKVLFLSMCQDHLCEAHIHFFSHMGNVKSDIPCISYIPSLFLQFNFQVTSTPCLYLLRPLDFDLVTITKLISYFPQRLVNLPTFYNIHHFHISIEKWSHYSSITIYFE